MGELVLLVLLVAVWIGWTAAFRNNPAWGTAKVYWGGILVMVILFTVATMLGRGS